MLGLGHTVMTGFSAFIFNDSSFSIQAFIFKSMFFCLTMGLFITNYHFWALHQLGIQVVTKTHLKPFQTYFCTSNLAISEVISKLNMLFPELKLIKSTPQSVAYHKGISLKSWGEKVSIIFTNNNGKNGYIITSKPTLFQLSDNGSGLSNVLIINQLIKKM